MEFKNSFTALVLRGSLYFGSGCSFVASVCSCNKAHVRLLLMCRCCACNAFSGQKSYVKTSTSCANKAEHSRIG